ncbi:hypothetical protein BZG02_18890 [Labilibaculum filiforme]|uniref:TonB C-terminal domain-containing protein n=1 Tax=Labilibaculum filiforme TaxID=1940526 RepID=A0A2N3HR64_9BACT|nr:energy transducer TonB [Labilibaculum filiforme]PKQ60532.1 hypothetical protein BZG02_18890 [Labilibaculum filiforme]
MRTVLSFLFLLISTQFAFPQQDTIVYYKKYIPQTTCEGADQQIVIQRKNKLSSIMMTCSWKENKWKVDKTEIIKLQKDGSYKISNGSYCYQRSYKKINDGYEVQEFNHKGQLINKGLSRTRFPLHRVGQWQNLNDGDIVGISIYKEETMTKSYIISNEKHLPTNTYANADSLAVYTGGEEAYSKALANNIVYPTICQENGITGRVLVVFAINEHGIPTEIQILKGENQYFNEAAISAIQKCKDWTPAFKNGQVVKVYNIAPVNFKLQ